MSTIIPIDEIFLNDFFSVQVLTKETLFMVEYTDNKENFCPRLIQEHDARIKIELGKLGKFKNLH